MLFEIESLPGDALEAAARFHAEILPAIETALADAQSSLIIALPAAGHDHRSWRQAAVQGLARKYAPLRINALEAPTQTARRAAIAFLEDAPGVTGQILTLDAKGAGPVSGP